MTDTPAPTTIKPGYKTTEAWLTLASQLLGWMYASGVIGDAGTAAKVAALAAAGLSALGYSVSRGMAKSA